jgi:hypothetical protein
VDWLVALTKLFFAIDIVKCRLSSYLTSVGTISLLKTYLVYTLAIAITCLALPSPASTERQLPAGEPTAAGAAAPKLPGSDDRVTPFAAIGESYAYADTTDDYQFPEDEEQKHVWRDVVIWLAVAGFVAFFVIKVFLEGDKDEPQTEEPGKQVPPSTLTVPWPSH